MALGKGVLLYDHDRESIKCLMDCVRELGLPCKWTTVSEQFCLELASGAYAMVFVDFTHGDMEMVDALANQSAIGAPVKFIMVGGYGSETGQKALSRITCEIFTKPLDRDSIISSIREGLPAHLEGEKGDAWRKSFDLGGMVGNGEAIRKVYEVMARVAPSDSTVLIQGESGTGKELIAKTIHLNSPRSHKPFIPVNCAALPEALLESELFGHEKGSFTGAILDRKGLFEEATGGTLFLDEISEMSPGTQAKLLRALQEHRIRPVGGNLELSVDARIVAATNQDLQTLVSEGRFRMDLYYRLNVVNVTLPSLRERMDDLPILAAHFLKRYARKMGKPIKYFDPPVMERLYRYSWVGNIRELENIVECCVAMARGSTITVEDLPVNFREKIQKHPRKTRITDQSYDEALAEFETVYFSKLMERCRGNFSQAARMSGISRKSIRMRLRKLGLDKLGVAGQLKQEEGDEEETGEVMERVRQG